MDEDVDSLVSELMLEASSAASEGDWRLADLLKRSANVLSWLRVSLRTRDERIRVANQRLPVNHRVDEGSMYQREAL